ncbi:threonine aldolase family protein [Paracoccus xiamenensis]|uniref:threonine aldolase family protein n=1 Tax=Paracoccus xiamenensis TaxID=2714901 RepID=UPI001407C9A0|nr:aminotransferase class V-fold PLP-dependent enzyme [Paracoccus xiamenensis]NHF73814.1 aminotransferase class V-fold PLP-dependent enzyme [Paracoccus xiamenensis]
MNFASDNCSGVHPSVMAALAAANEGHVASYGNDALTRAAEDRVREVLDAPEAVVLFTATGTAANAIALGGAVQPWQRIFCNEDAHIETSECAAPEMFTGGAKLTLIPGEGGLIDADALDRAASFWAGEGLGGGKPGAISITNATEWGRVWTPGMVTEIAAIARQHKLVLHMDGARFANAVAASGAVPADVTHRAGVDLLSFGGTKNGGMGVEAVVAFDPELADRLAFTRKRSGHLLSKHRYLSAQFYALLEAGLWLDLAGHANEMAALLAEGLNSVDGARLAHPAEANQVFAVLPADAHDRARAAGATYFKWSSLDETDQDEVTVRFVCGWNTTDAEVEALLVALRG